MKRKKQIKRPSPDVRPLDQRESKSDTRKGIKRKATTVNISFLEQEQLLFPGENEFPGDLTQPDYLIKGNIP